MNQHTVSYIAIYLLSIVMIVFGIYHFLHPKTMLVYVPAFIPGGIVWVYVVGVAFILAALAFMSNRLVKLAAYLLAGLLLVFVVCVHIPNYLHSGDWDMRQRALTDLLKDTALAAFALHIASNAKHQRFSETVDDVTREEEMNIES